jgi:hypothetical protein
LFERGFNLKTGVRFGETLLEAGSLHAKALQFGGHSRFFAGPRDFKGKPDSTFPDRALGVSPGWRLLRFRQ